MAELDFALLSDYASVADSKLTIVGGSFTFMQISQIPGPIQFAVTGRVRAQLDEAVLIGIKLRSEGGPEVEFDGQLQAGPGSRPYKDGRVGILFAFNTEYPIFEPGLVEVEISLGGSHVRRLAFEVESI